MNQPEPVRVLTRLLHVLCRSLPRYLEDARPWTRRDDERAQEVLADVAAAQGILAERVARAIVQQGGRPDPGRFPIEFAAINDLALDSLRQRLIEYQGRDVAAIGRCVAELRPALVLRSLAEEALADARRHLDVLKEMRNDER